MTQNPLSFRPLRRSIALATAAAVLAIPLAAAAEGASGLSGFVLDARTQAPIPGITIVVARDESPPRDKHEIRTGHDGFFSDVGLQPGRYILVTEARGHLVSCIVDDVHSGVVRRVKMLVGRTAVDTQCVGPVVRHNLDPDETASLYRVH